ncbi:MAG: glycoside hydrolase family 3 C-terminal domain-containing protein [Oscillospiraceae bacterium]|jgi:beta-glucosidase|nr:glycoside hydrolase family 3 C-terminal domain-containing protein [Oscillospiraceae bacterium]
MRNEAAALAAQLTPEEKYTLVKGLGTWNTAPIDRLGLPSIMMSDGPHGLRKQENGGENPLGLGDSIKTVCFPTAAGAAASFSRELLKQLGETLGKECRAHNLSMLLGPAVNIKRSPLCGRNFEYFSEDPYLSAEMAVAYTQGLQSQGVGVSLKHFAANNQEKRRMTVQSVVDERALREIYFPAFEQTVKRADPWTIMCAYNRLFDGIYCSENKRLLTEVLREEWGFDGVVVSDWGAVSNRAKGIAAGLDLEMPDSRNLHKEKLIAALENGELAPEALDAACTRIIDLILRVVEATQADEAPPAPADNDADHALARQYARESMVLLKNNGVLPLQKDAQVAFIGGFAVQPRCQGGGSSHVHTHKVTTALHTALAAGLPVEYAEGFGVRDYEYDLAKTAQAVVLARHCDVAVIFAGLPEHLDSEGADRKHIDLPPCQNELIRAVAAVQPNTVVVLCNGSAVRMPWVNNAAAILESYLAGEAVGEAQIDLLYGEANPSAKLAETFPLLLQDTPCYGNFPGGTATVEYRESIYVGYRYYDKAEKAVLFPFGHGLSYTTFEYTNLRLSRKNYTPEDTVDVSLTVRNTGTRDGAEVVQIYVSPPADGDSESFRPVKELKGFTKVFLAAGEKKRVTITLNSRAFAYWHTGTAGWVCAPGVYGILAAASSQDIRLRTNLKLHNDDAPASPYRALDLPAYRSGQIAGVGAEEFERVLGFTLPAADCPAPCRLGLDSTIEDAARQSPLGRLLFKIISYAQPVAQAITGNAIGDISSALESIPEMPIRTIAMWSDGLVNAEMVDAIVSMFNEEHYLRSIATLAKGGARALKKLLCGNKP